MADVKELKPGDRCPNCGGELKPLQRLSLDEYKRIYDRDNPEPLPPHTDTMHPDQVKRLGALYACATCDYKTRFPLDAGDPARQSTGGSGGAGAGASGGSSGSSGSGDEALAAAKRRVAELERERAGQGASAGG